MRKLAILIPVLLILTLGQPASAQLPDSGLVYDTNHSGGFWIFGAQHKNHWGYASGGGVYRPLLGEHLFFVIPATVQIGADSEHAEAMLNLSPHIGYSIWRVILTAGPGYTNLWEKKRYTGSFKFEGSLSFVIDRVYKWSEIKDNRVKGDLQQVAITVAAQYWPGNKAHAVIVGFTFFH